MTNEYGKKILKIRDLIPGQTAEIAGYEQGDPRYRSKLLSLGLTKTTRIKLLKTAPLGDPVEIEVRGFHLSLRKAEADVIILHETEPLLSAGGECCRGRDAGHGGTGLHHRVRRRLGRLFGSGGA